MTPDSSPSSLQQIPWLGFGDSVTSVPLFPAGNLIPSKRRAAYSQNFQESGPSVAACPSSVASGWVCVFGRGHAEGRVNCTPTQEGRVPAGPAGTALNQVSSGAVLTGRAVDGVQTVLWGRKACSLKDDSSPEGELSGHMCRVGL